MGADNLTTRWGVTLLKTLEVDTGFFSKEVLAHAFLMVVYTVQQDILPEDPESSRTSSCLCRHVNCDIYIYIYILALALAKFEVGILF